MTSHIGKYLPGTADDPYRLCLVCKQWRRNWWYKPVPLIHNGGKPRRRQ